MSSQAADASAPDGVRLSRYLPLSLVVTLAVTLVPLLAVAQLGPARGPLGVALHVLAAIALSILLARLLEALWTRHRQASDLVFGDLLLWGWARRAVAERRLDATARRLARAGEPTGDRAALLQRMSTLLETRDPYTHGHSRRVARHAEQVARGMGLSRERVEKVRAAALVHDLGKINVPRSILTKPGKLTDEEFALVRRHPGDGAAMVGELDDPELTAIVRHHHERIDGTGYPDGLAGADIPVGARVIAVADTFDAMTSARAYRRPRTHKQAREVLQREAGTQLDAEAVAAFVSYYAARRSVGLVALIAAAPQRLLAGLGGVPSGVGASVAPIAQTACGVGGIALIGACIGGPMLPAASSGTDRPRGAESRQLAAKDGRGLAAAPGTAIRAGGDRGTPERSRRPAGDVGGPDTPAESRERGTGPRALEVPVNPPPGGGAGGQQGGGSGSGPGRGGGGVDLPQPPPVLPDPGAVVEPVTDLLPPIPVPLPAPVPVPELGLP
jgi:response regulator RpfG family c-di-GMP phosphodiesterase